MHMDFLDMHMHMCVLIMQLLTDSTESQDLAAQWGRSLLAWLLPRPQGESLSSSKVEGVQGFRV